MPSYTGGSSSSRAAKRPAASTGGTSSSLAPTGGSALPVPAPDGKSQRQAKKLLMDSSHLAALQDALRLIGVYVNSRHLEMLAPSSAGNLYTSKVKSLDPSQASRSGIAVYRISKLMYDEEENVFEKLVSVYSALNSFGGLVAMILQSDGVSVQLYLATNTSGSSTIAGDLLFGNLRGQFPGCEITQLSEANRNRLLDSIRMVGKVPAGRTIRSMSMIPSRREDERQHDKQFSAQGYEKFIDAMSGRCYTLVVLSQRVSPDALEECLEGLENLYTCLSPYAKETASYAETESDSVNYAVSSNISSSVTHSISNSFGTMHTNSVAKGRSSNRGRGYNLFGINFNSGKGKSFGTATATGHNQGHAVNDGTTEGLTSGDSQSEGTTVGTNRSITMNRENKSVQNLMTRIEEHIKRIHFNQTFGMWNSACYMIADDVATATMGASTLASLFSGDSMVTPRAYYNQWDVTNACERDKVLDYLQSLQHPVINLTILQETTDQSGTTKRSIIQTEQVTPAMMIGGKEIPTLMGLPRKSVPGLVADTMAEFGRNIPEEWKRRVKRPVVFGNIYHMGQEEKTQTVLDLDTFASHMFICGASGSGKSNTTFNLMQKLIEQKVPFLVIEPAKGEYKIEFAGLKGINIFTAHESPYRLLQINPFEFNPAIHIREHLDNILQAVGACWPLYGAMPGLLKQAFEQVYLNHGWDLDHSERIMVRGSKFPVFRDLVGVLEHIIDESPYSAQTKGDYKGALLNRISSLCNGFEGQIFGRSIGVPDRTLFNENTVIDLSSIGSDETRSLIMGILIIKLRNHRKAAATAPNSELIHVTVLEEAHNILKRCSHDTNVESGNVQGAAVESLCRCIAEMRSAGEGFMIIDQSPGTVDETAIKNTAIKIVMRLPSKGDCEEIGAALSLRDNQIREISRLDIGVAAVFHAGWTDTVLARMGDVWDKRYRVSSLPVLDNGTYTRVQGALIQMMYRNIIDGDYFSTYDDAKELISLLCSGPNTLRPTLPFSKQKEILDEIQVFLQDNELYIRAKRTRDIKREFFDFAFEFLRLDSVMRMCPLSGINPGMGMTTLSKREVLTVLKWENEIRPGIVRYLYMPEECDPKGAYRWPLNGTDAEYFGAIYGEILTRFAMRYSKDYRYANALDYLNKTKFFDRFGKKT